MFSIHLNIKISFSEINIKEQCSKCIYVLNNFNSDFLFLQQIVSAVSSFPPTLTAVMNNFNLNRNAFLLCYKFNFTGLSRSFHI